MGLAGAMALMFTACATDEPVYEESGNSRMVKITTQLSTGDDTRTIIGQTADKLDLTWEWKEGDQVAVYTGGGSAGNSECIGIMTAQSNGTTAVFEGDLEYSKITDDTKYVLVYPGRNNKVEIGTKKLDMSGYLNQTGKLADLPDYDWLSTEEAYTMPAPVNNTIVLPSATVVRQMALVKFSVGQENAGKTVWVYGNGDNTKTLYSTIEYGFTNYGKLSKSYGTAAADTHIEATADANGDVYLSLPPNTYDLRVGVMDNGKLKEGTLGELKLTQPVYYRADGGNGIAFTFAPEAVSDDTILGVKWAHVNNRSWTCPQSGYNVPINNFITYIPEIDVESQGLYCDLSEYGGRSADLAVDANSIAVINSQTQNSEPYYYQWGRNFGFRDGETFWSYISVPNGSSLPTTSLANYGSNASAYSKSVASWNPHVFLTNGDFWCTETYENWENNHVIYYDGKHFRYMFPVTPAGFRLPTIYDFYKLLPEGKSNITYTCSKTVNYEEGNLSLNIGIFFAKQDPEAHTTVVYGKTLLNSVNYLSLFEVPGLYTIDEITSDILKSRVDYCEFVAAGMLHHEQQMRIGNTYGAASVVTGAGTEGWYWGSDSYNNDEGYLFYFKVSGNSVTLRTGSSPKNYALTVRCIYDESASQKPRKTVVINKGAKLQPLASAKR